MSVAVYSRLGELLEARNLTVAELGDQITSRYGLVVDAEVVARMGVTLPSGEQIWSWRARRRPSST